MYVSTGLTPIALTRTSTCVGPGVGTGTSSILRTSGEPNSRTTTAFMRSRAPELSDERGMLLRKDAVEIAAQDQGGVFAAHEAFDDALLLLVDRLLPSAREE